MKTLTLTDICCYQPYGLKMKNGGFIGDLITATYDGELRVSCSNWWEKISDNKYLPILRPISSLTTPITHKGETFVPLLRLAEIAFPQVKWSMKGAYCRGAVDGDITRSDFMYNGIAQSFHCHWHRLVTVPNQLALFRKLSEWMFDYTGLIESGIAVSVDTLNENPYA